MNRHKELNFIALVSIVIGSQIGSGAFILPSLLAPFGVVGLFGWIVSVSGAVSLALIFSELSSKLPKNGGPHVYVTEAFGRKAGFFTAWIYWLISWSSNSVLLVTTVSYLSIITGKLSSIEIIIIETIILSLITIVNILGVKFSGIVETVLTFLKVVPLVVLPVIFMFFFDWNNFHFNLNCSDLNCGGVAETVAKTGLLTFWCFIGVECATTPAESVKNPKKTIPMAIIIGTVSVAFIYLSNSITVIGVSGFDSLMQSDASYAVAMKKVFGSSSDFFISATAIIVCLGTLNAWTLTSGQIAYGAFEDKLFPKIFGKVNKSGAPVAAIIISSVGMIPFFIVEQMDFVHGLNKLIDLLVSIFLIIYLVCAVSYMKMIRTWKKTTIAKIKAYSLAIFSVVFCVFVLAQNIIASLVVFFIFVLLGCPVFFKNKKNILNKT